MSSSTDPSVHELIDAWLPERALVVGSLPPAGRDLDLLVRPAAEQALTQALADAGFERSAGGWLRFARGTVELVDVIPAADWGLPEDELDTLMRHAVPLVNGGRLARPAPHHTLLILSRRLAADGELAPRRRARLQKAVGDDARAWETAREHAAAWGAEQQLERLREFVTCGFQAPSSRPAWRRLALHAIRPVRKWVRRVRGRPGGCVIALSGLDGAGKSSQAQALRDTLERLGYDVAVEWTRLGWNEGFWVVVTAVKSRLNRMAGITTARDGAAPVDPVKALRERSSLLTHVWATVIALDDARVRRRLTRHHLRAGRVVICDRYMLDSIVSLRCKLDEHRRFRFQRWLIGRLSPRPLRAFLLEVSPETAWERKGEHGLPFLRSHFERYREECDRMGVRRLDGERPPDELAALIAADVWHALTR